MMNNFFKNLSQGFIIELVKYFIVYLIIQGGFYTVLSILRRLIDLQYSNYYFYILLFLIGILSFIILYKRFNRKVLSLPDISFDFRIVELEILHKIKNKQHYKHIRKFKLKALRNGLNRYSDKFLWTGGKYEMKSGNNKHTVMPSRSINIFDTYIIDFDRTYNKNEIIDVIVEWELFGEGRPFISKQIEEPTDKLILTVEFADNLFIEEVGYEETYLQGSKRTLGHDAIETKNNIATKAINNPKLIHLYELKWRW